MSVTVNAETLKSGAPGKVSIQMDSGTRRLMAVLEDGSKISLQKDENFENALINGGFIFAQRQVPGTLTTYSNTSGRTFTADRWGVTNENASVQYQRVDTSGSPETGLTARYYGKFKKITSAGKIIVSHVIEGQNVMPYRGRAARLQFKQKYSVASSMTTRVILLQLTNAGTMDTIPATFASAFGASGVDPTWGTNLSALTPRLPDGGTIVGSGLTCVLGANWGRTSAVYDIPSNCKNLIAVVVSNSQLAANDELNLSEAQLNDGEEIQDWSRDLVWAELAKCQRYFCKSFNVDTAAAQNAGLAGAVRGYVSVAGATAGQPIGIRFPVPMRAAPGTFAFYNPSAANAFVRNTTAATDATATASANVSEQGADITFTGIAAWTVAQAVAVHFAADAEL